MKIALGFSLVFLLVAIFPGCSATKNTALNISEEEKTAFTQSDGQQDTVLLSSDATEYELIIIEPGFNTWLQGVARPKGFYSQSFLERRNLFYVNAWNQRTLSPQRYDPMLYQMQIDYDSRIDYGYDLNFKLYNYFIYFQRKYRQRLGPFTPRI